MSTVVELKVPDIGDFDSVEVIELLVKPGDSVRVEQSLITVESDKASMEIPASAAGVVRALRVKIGDKVSEGSVLLELETTDAPSGVAGSASAVTTTDVAVPAPAPVAVPVAGPAPAPVVPAAAPEAARALAPLAIEAHVPTATDVVNRPHASPSVRSLARELGVDLVHVAGTGPKGRITPEDVRAYVKAAVAQALAGSVQSAANAAGGVDAGGAGAIPLAAFGGRELAAWPKVDFAKFGEIETRPLARIKKLSGANLHRNWLAIPHVTNHDDADIT
ncbi:MAG: hypothetical protein EBT08_16160, partial [Betaproteobacteria bacterium]|nr:hypothetical protein [Betaproteobacteria bacterium]